ncbi:MAG: S-layer homology domain-containing protein, partial [Clostridiales bacterium]|nr:S-layer homology domain-containing protein [Clostridiales bacterium]
PDEPVTRAETATVIFRVLLAGNKNEPVDNPFSDVPEDEWYAQPIKYLASIGILKGDPEGTFRPDALITRAEFAAIISGFHMSADAGDNRFADTEGHWAADYINGAAAKGWVSGYPDGTFQPENRLTRAEIVTAVNRMMYRWIKTDDIPDWAPRYTDIDDSHWAYAAIIEASVGHEYERNEDGSEIWIRHRDFTKVIEV